MFDSGAIGWLLLQGTLLAATGVALSALAPGLSASGRARVALATLILMSGVGCLGAARLGAWSWGHWLRGTERGERASPTASGAPASLPAASTVESERVARGDGDSPVPGEVSDWALALAAIFEPAEPLPAAPPVAAPRRWLVVLIGGIVAAQSLGLVRLLAGGLWVARCRRRAAVVDDPAMCGALAAIAGELGLRRSVGIAEVAGLSTPALVGWRRPMVLLPSDWRTWSAAERRAVLAHELAHVRRRDYLTTAVAGFALVPQFYHPLAHWLAARMRVEQELAADALACGPAGGRERYLRALAGLALRRADARSGWLASAFLPTRRMFVRRIEMLRTLRVGAPRGAAVWNAAAGLALAVVAVAVSGLRPLPAAAQQNEGQAPARGKAVAEDQRQEEAVPGSIDDPVQLMASSAIGAIVDLDIRQLRNSPQIQPLIDRWPREMAEGIEQALGAPLDQVERVTIGFANAPPSLPLGRYIGHAVTYADADAAEAVGAAEVKLGGFAAAPPRDGGARGGDLERARVAPTMVLSAAPGQMRIFLLAALGGEPAADSLAGRLMEFDPSDSDSPRPPVRVAYDVEALRPTFQRLLVEAQGAGPMLAAFEPLVMDVDRVLLGVTAEQTLKVAARFDCRSPEAAARVTETLGAVRVLARNALRNEFGPATDPAERMIVNAIASAGGKLLDSLEFTSRDTSVIVQGEVEAPQVAMLMTMALPAIQQSRAAARQMQSLNNLKQIALALHNYHDVYGHLPPAVVEGPDGVKRSWRVELLPFVEAAPLYERYRKDEPWDSENNLQVLKEMPPTYRHPTQPEGTTDTAYLTIVGEGTALSGEAPRFRDFTDGLSNTVLVVESKRGVPWTKPDDLPLDPEAILAAGFTPGGLATVFADGAARVLSHDLDPDEFRKMVTRDGGEPVEIPRR